MLSLGDVHKRQLKDFEGQNKIIHSLDSMSFLKVDQINFIQYQCQDYNNRVISIQQEWSRTIEGVKETFFD